MGIVVSGAIDAKLKKQVFIASEGQTEFSITLGTLTDVFQAFVDDAIQTNATRTAQVVTIPGGCSDGSNVVIFY